GGRFCRLPPVWPAILPGEARTPPALRTGHGAHRASVCSPGNVRDLPGPAAAGVARRGDAVRGDRRRPTGPGTRPTRARIGAVVRAPHVLGYRAGHEPRCGPESGYAREQCTGCRRARGGGGPRAMDLAPTEALEAWVVPAAVHANTIETLARRDGQRLLVRPPAELHLGRGVRGRASGPEHPCGRDTR